MIGAAILALAAAAAPPTPEANARIASLEARLLLSDSGRLSANVLDRAGHFTGWNTPIGEGDAEGAAEDVLVIVGLAAKVQGIDALLLDRPLVVTARTAKTLLATRTFDNIVLPFKGQSYSAIYLPGVGCAGAITITARLGTEVRTARLDMDCGE